jgi:TPR repeat protein
MMRCFCLALALGASFAVPAATSRLMTHPIVIAVRHGSCQAAVNLVNPRVNSNDDQTAFLAGRMLDEGICVHRDSEAATDFFARAADLGDHLAILDYATQIGLG